MSSRRHSFGIVALAFAALGCSLPSIAAEKAHVLVYSGSTGFRHDSIPAAVEALKSIGAKAGYVVDATEDPEVFTAEKLKAYKAIVLVSTSTDPKKPESEWFVGEKRDALQGFLKAGKGVVGPARRR